jgi:hypothetical protein
VTATTPFVALLRGINVGAASFRVVVEPNVSHCGSVVVARTGRRFDPASLDPTMKHSVLAAFLLCCTLVSAPSFAQEDASGSGARRDPSPIEAQMEQLDEAVDAVADFLKKPAGDAPLASVAAAQAALHEAKQHVPNTTERQPEGERAAFVKDYRLQINKTMRGLLDLEDALLGEDWKAAEKVLGELQKQKKAGHDKFKGRRQRGGAGGGGKSGGGR